MTTPYDPATQLRADATDAQILARGLFIFHEGTRPAISIARELQAATVAEYEAKLAAHTDTTSRMWDDLCACTAKLAQQPEAHCIRVVGDHLMPNDGGPCVICFPTPRLAPPPSVSWAARARNRCSGPPGE